MSAALPEPTGADALARGELARAAEAWWKTARATRDAAEGRRATAWSAVAAAFAGDRTRLDRARAVLARCPPPTTPVERLADAAHDALAGRRRQAAESAAAAATSPDAGPEVVAWAALVAAECEAALGHPSAAVRAERARVAATAAAQPYVLARLDLLRLERAVHAGDAGAVLEARPVVDPVPAAQGRRLAAHARAALAEGRHGDARLLHERALALLTEAGDGPGVAASAGGIGLCRVAASANAEAMPWLTQAVARCTRMGALADELVWRGHLDDVLARLHRHEARVPELLAAIEIARALEDRDQERALWRTRLGCCEEVGDRPGAEQCRAALAALGDG